MQLKLVTFSRLKLHLLILNDIVAVSG